MTNGAVPEALTFDAVLYLPGVASVIHRASVSAAALASTMTRLQGSQTA
jgi:hypothetical protein